MEQDPPYSDFMFDSGSLHQQRRMEAPSAQSGGDFQTENEGIDEWEWVARVMSVELKVWCLVSEAGWTY